MHQFISGTFNDAEEANKAVGDLLAVNYPRDRITIIMSVQTRNRFWSRLAQDPKQENRNTT